MKLGKKILISQSILLVLIGTLIFLVFALFVIPNNNKQMHQKARELTYVIKTTLKYADSAAQQDRCVDIVKKYS